MQSCIDDSSASEWNLYRQPFLVKDILFHLDLEKSRIFRSTLSDMVMLTCTKVRKWFLRYPLKQSTLSINLRAFNLKVERYTNLVFNHYQVISLTQQSQTSLFFDSGVMETCRTWLQLAGHLLREEGDKSSYTQITQCCGFRKNTPLCLIFI